MSLLQHCFIISRKVHKTTEKAQNISSKSHILNTLASRNIYFQLAPIGITRLLTFRHLLLIETYQGLSFPLIYTWLVCKYSKGDWCCKVNFSMCRFWSWWKTAADAGYEFSLARYVKARRSQVALHGMRTLFIPPGRGREGGGGGEPQKKKTGGLGVHFRGLIFKRSTARAFAVPFTGIEPKNMTGDNVLCKRLSV